VASKDLRLWFSHRELDDRRRIEIGRHYFSALVAAQTLEYGRGQLQAWGPVQRLRQVVEVGRRRFNFSGRPHSFEGRTLGYGGEMCYRSATVRDLHNLSAFDQPEQLACPLPQLANPDRCHVLLIAHFPYPSDA
jgi:hypothetical protein